MTSATDGIAGGCVNAACQIVGVTTIYPTASNREPPKPNASSTPPCSGCPTNGPSSTRAPLASQPKWQPFHGEAAPLQSWRHLNCQMSFDPKPVATEVSVVGADRLHGPVRPRARDR